MDSFSRVYKVGTHRGKPHIWIDGKPLTVAGFVGGDHYWCLVREGNMVLSIVKPHVSDAWKQRKVTGRPNGKPLIDMNGRDVETAFPGAAAVRVSFEWGLITITRAD